MSGRRRAWQDFTTEPSAARAPCRGPWNQGGDWKYVEAPAFQQLRELGQHGHLPSEAS